MSLDRLLWAARQSRIGLGLAAVGRPGYINLGRDRDLPAERTVEALRERSHQLLDAAYAARGPVLRRRPLVRAGRGVPGRLARRAPGRGGRQQVGLHVHGRLAGRRRRARAQGPQRRHVRTADRRDAFAARRPARPVPDPLVDPGEHRAHRCDAAPETGRARRDRGDHRRLDQRAEAGRRDLGARSPSRSVANRSSAASSRPGTSSSRRPGRRSPRHTRAAGSSS